MQVGRKYRIYPNARQAETLNQWIGCQRVIRNAKVEETRYRMWLCKYSKFSARGGNLEDGYSFDQAYSHLCGEEKPWLREVPSQILRNGAYRAKVAFDRFFARKAAFPVRHKKQATESVLLTSELFTILAPPHTDEEPQYLLHVGTRSFPVGFIKWVAHRQFLSPSMLTITRHGNGDWEVSFTFDDGKELPDNEDLLIQHSFAQAEAILALDRGVIHPLVDSEGEFYDWPEEMIQRMAHLDRRYARFQEKLSRQVKGSNNRQKTKKILAGIAREKQNIILNWSHKTTHRICSGAHPVIVMEDLSLQNMSKRPKARMSETERPDGLITYEPNGAAAKAGLNRSLHRVGLGRLSSLTQYKARKSGKAYLCTPAPFSSQECHQCHHTSPDNRPTQAEFYCQACGHQTHADYNASMVHRQRGLSLLLNFRPAGLSGRKSPATRVPTASRKPPPKGGR